MVVVNVLVIYAIISRLTEMPSQNGVADERTKLFPLNISIISAKLHGVSGLFNKPPDVYVEVIADSITSRKTAVRKKTNAPQWDEQIQIQIHESSVLEFRVFGKSKLFEDSLIGQKILKMSHAIKKESDNGKCNRQYKNDAAPFFTKRYGKNRRTEDFGIWYRYTSQEKKCSWKLEVSYELVVKVWLCNFFASK
ncbi:unnamed protein product [Wuchereria bancrofti]|uniref:C2 domain-containing protein n=1 Tax=Wuchereria bancrofti TaxID=6293 RepID=A0A3P7FDF1_WUCBA|nr:unnamed protein product [Wuchereria bancrofti]